MSQPERIDTSPEALRQLAENYRYSAGYLLIETLRALADEKERLEKALDILTDGSPLTGGRAVKGNDKLPDQETQTFYRGYNAGIDSQFEWTGRLVEKLRALLRGAPGG